MEQVSSQPPIRISVVIPAYNEEAYLPRLLDTIAETRGHYVHGERAVEVIVGDNDSTDRTAEVAEEYGCRVAHVEKRAIGAARNGGAAIARGEILLFVDSDKRVHPETLNAVDEAMATGKYVTGALGEKAERMSLGLFFTFMLAIPVDAILQLSTGPVFCRREDYETVGGYSEELLYGEDIRFLKDLKALGRPRGQRFVRLNRVKAISSSRKWDKRGDWDIFKIIFLHIWTFFLPRRYRKAILHRFALDYWYEDRAEGPPKRD